MPNTLGNFLDNIIQVNWLHRRFNCLLDMSNQKGNQLDQQFLHCYINNQLYKVYILKEKPHRCVACSIQLDTISQLLYQYYHNSSLLYKDRHLDYLCIVNS
jgi:hypothetical protein